ncbi:MAG: hypothetical protein KDD62_11290, partial [Bdellovibrionales bacterium]|nr:hypothetical protein [Bdellovibrionales bacterium]
GDLRSFSETELIAAFGKTGTWFYRISRGIDERPVSVSRTIKSVSTEDTFSEDLLDPEQLNTKLEEVAHNLFRRLSKKDVLGRTLTLKVTYADFTKITRSHTEDSWIESEDDILNIAAQLISQTEAGGRPIRLLGLGVSNLNNVPPSASLIALPVQLSFPFEATSIRSHAKEPS